MTLGAEPDGVAAENVAKHRLHDRIDLLCGDLFDPLVLESDADKFDLIVCNPPYVSAPQWEALEPEVRDHDPRDALVAGTTGIEVYRTLAPVACTLLRSGGWLVLELGVGQAREVGALVTDAGLRTVEVRPDLHGIDRVLATMELA